MSQFCTMPTGERKTQAAAICREVHGANGHVMDLGKKLCTPKDIMLEELSLMSNRGSRLFKMRQRRSEKYTFENIQNEANALLNSDPLTQNAEIHADGEKTSSGTGNAVNPQCIAPDVVVVESCEATSMPRCYYSPWEEAIINDPELAETIKLRMPPPEPRAVLPDYKCFNRVATPFGGFDRAPRGIRFKLPEVDLNPPSYPELQGGREMTRPTFNRTAQGWITDGSSLVLPCLALEPAEIPESDDL